MTAFVSRRQFIAGASALFAWSFAPRALSAAGINVEDNRLLVVILRGGLDGLTAVPAIGDPAFNGLRAITKKQKEDLATGLLPLGDIFAMNARLATLHNLYKRGEALIVHAVATPSRERSHFAAQDVLESGYPSLGGRIESGWLNRALQVIPKGARIQPIRGLAVAPTMPLIMRGPAPVDTWQPQTFQSADIDTISRLHVLYQSTDPALADALLRGAEIDALIGTNDMQVERIAGMYDVSQSVAAATRLMAKPDGPRIATMNIYGWDTHVDQGFESGRIGRQLFFLDRAIAAVRDGLQAVWSKTVVAIVTEFGRTVRINGSSGTDHGTGTIALLLGGAVNGGRIIADWPGLAPAQLFEGRDLAPTTDLRSVLKGVLAEHYGIESAVLSNSVFPGSSGVVATRGLCRNA